VDGYELLRRIRQCPNGKLVPAVAVTAYARLDDRREVLAAGFDDHIAKPIDPDSLVDAVITTLCGHGRDPRPVSHLNPTR
jgi:CheY-like chemotaxis protein